MKANLKKVSLVALMGAFAAPAAFATATDGRGTVTFNGELTSNTCTIDAGDVDKVVTLPTVSTSSLTAAGQTAGATMFSISVSGCSADVTQVAAHFETTNLDQASRGAKNLYAGTSTDPAATFVAVQMLDSDGTTVLNLGTKGTAVPVTDSAATMYYGGRYYANGKTTAGKVQAVVSYTLAYN
ncbi:type 1 fimbrial protein [Trinickia terrae]|uniref:Type 1 fimbrial protein n=1 Tax=Trinickia terrae TaxID=2571161 RepID=A0A4U1I7G3_9BURK|nr:fimbrial protein [Trinickia terrae]TKC89353.1 type 1 fimbrial protein [Trinickia terrae]